MKSLFRICAFTLFFTTIALFAQRGKSDVNPQANPAPQLSTADKVALQSIQKTQQDAAKEWQDAEQQKLLVLREWGASHPGFHIHYNSQLPSDPQNYSVEAEGKPNPPTATEKTPVKAPEPAKK